MARRMIKDKLVRRMDIGAGKDYNELAAMAA